MSTASKASRSDVVRPFETAGIPRHEAIALLAAATGLSHVQVVAGSRPIADDAQARFEALAARRRAGEPLAYLVGRREFFGRPFAVGPDVLIPRDDTEALVAEALAWLATRSTRDGRAVRALELGTGSGAVAVTLALECPAIDMTATDLSAAALAVAAANATRLGASVRWVGSDWFAAFERSAGAPPAAFDLIVSNPPYVAAGDPHLDRGDLRFEPRLALTDEADGLAALRRIVAAAPGFLAHRGALMVEHGFDQAAPVRALFVAAGFVDVASHRDLAGIERVTVGTVTP